jgi:hypothetical protein
MEKSNLHSKIFNLLSLDNFNNQDNLKRQLMIEIYNCNTLMDLLIIKMNLNKNDQKFISIKEMYFNTLIFKYNIYINL